jgi:hypothetical protein
MLGKTHSAGLETVEKRKILPLPEIKPQLCGLQPATTLTAILTTQYTTKSSSDAV